MRKPCCRKIPVRLLLVPAVLGLVLGLRPVWADEGRARALLNALGCKGCHLLQGQGGHLAPSLDRVGTHLTPAQLGSLFSGNRPAIPAHDLSFLAPEERQALVDFLAELTAPPPAYIQTPPGTSGESSP